MSPHDVPTAQQLIESVREWIERDVLGETTGRLQFHARVAINVLAMVERELELGPQQARRPRRPAASPRLRRRRRAGRGHPLPAMSSLTTQLREAVHASVRDKLSGGEPEVPAGGLPTLTGSTAERDRLHRLAGGELTAGGVDVGAAVAAHGGVHAERLEPVAELAHALERRAAGRLARASG